MIESASKTHGGEGKGDIVMGIVTTQKQDFISGLALPHRVHNL
jgi:hypothetical protein